MAEEKAAAPTEKAAAPGPEAGGAPAAGTSKKQSLILMVLAVVNMLVIFGVGFMIYQGRKKDAAEPKIDQVIKGEAETQEKEKKEAPVTGKVIPLDTFLVNFAGSKGRRVAKVNMEMEVEGEGVVSEIDQRKAQVRDIIIILLSGKTYDQVSNREGKDKLKEQIRDTVNAFLTKGKIKEVYFTEFIYN